MQSGEKRLRGTRCSGTTKTGKPCQALAGADGLCTAHRDPGRMRELGRSGGKARRASAAEQLPEGERQSLRQYLRGRLDHEKVRAAIEQSLAGANESARVAAVKFLAELELYKSDEERDEAARREEARDEVLAKLGQLIRSRAIALHRQGQADLAQNFREAADDLSAAAERRLADARGVVVHDMPAEQAQAVLHGLQEAGLIVMPERPEDRAEQLAQERLLALKQEHDLT